MASEPSISIKSIIPVLMLIDGPQGRVDCPINDWLADDESFFSLCSRIHFSAGCRRGSDTCRLLFDHPVLGLQHDFPSRLSSFVTATRCRFGDAAHLVQHTLFPFFLAWLTVERAAEAQAKICSDSSSYAWRFRLRTATCRFTSEHPLKGCPACVEEDLRQIGASYWRVHHQYPGVWVCRVHHCLLRTQQRRKSRTGGQSWCLPVIEEMSLVEAIRPEDLGVLERFTNYCAASVSCLTAVPAASYVGRIRVALDEIRPSDSSRIRKRLEAAADLYVAYLTVLRRCPNMRVLPADKRLAMAWLWVVKYGAWDRLHPLILLSIGHWALGHWGSGTDSAEKCR